MLLAPKPANERDRLQALLTLQVLDTASEDEFEALVRAASVVCGTPISLLTLIDSERLWFKAKIGFAGRTEAPRETSFCAHAILRDGIFEIPDTSLDPRFADNPVVENDPKIRFYAGAPIRLSSGHQVGVVCVVDQQPRKLDDNQREVLRCLAITAAKMLECRRAFIAQNQIAATLQTTLRELAVSKDQLRHLYEATPAMMHSIDAEGRLLMVSDAWLAKLGHARDEVIGRLSTDFLTEASRDYARAVVLPAFFKTGQCERIEYQMVGRDGALFDVLVSAIAERDGAGQTLRSLAVIEDVTARRRAERDLRASEARYRMLADSTNDVITQLDLKLDRRYVSPACRGMLGYEPDEMLRITLAAQIHPDDELQARKTMELLIAGSLPGDRAMTTSRLRHKQGHWVWLEAGMTLVRDPDTGAPLHLICSLRDISERRRVAQDLEQARLAAERAAWSKAEFLANMSHELRTPLTGILGIHDLMRSDPTLAPHHRRSLGLACEAGQSLMAIINDVLDFSKIEAGQLTIETVPFDLASLVEACRDFVNEDAQQKGLRLEARVTGGTAALLGDPIRLRQILLNLLTNAVKFTERGSVIVEGRYRPETARLRLSVSDTGIGIGPGQVASIFERFSQADGSITRRYGGTGLGLAICKRLAELMGGTIGVVSDLGRGSTFFVELPLSVSEAAATRQVAPAEATSGPRRVLLAEDNPLNQMIITDMLRQRGHTVTVVGDGQAAIAAMEGGVFDVVLMDVQMPVLDGFSATRAIRAAQAASGHVRTPIVGLTASAMHEDRERCRDAGMDVHVAKPIEWHRLFATIEELIYAARGTVETPAATAAAPGPLALDIDVLHALREVIGAERFAIMLDAFVLELQQRIVELDHMADPDLAGLAHGWTSMAGHFGFTELQQVCGDVEIAIRRGGCPRGSGLLQSAARRAIAAAASLPRSKAA
ncbi:PAS domain S-box protein [Lichenifustis flavocetrariae]|uniref:histidine kinase n=1 Tax=Lichenifustis flavocetrariae TaxID=2949735 RepID=A0AA41Z0Z3_9HYPH|nr:PAS domain S-box protein [Lichenifustis flavocetrariae]MCW6508513.1 PAS domain S-box protein [Lichenifustis flavocetrariae]